MTEWPQYESHKIVRAAKIVEIVEHGGNLSILVKPYGDDTVERFVPTEPAMILRAEVGDWAMLYPDGYKSISPAKQFEEGYTRIPD
jgi:hypothetical protein